MADGVAITAGSGTTIATDDAGASGHVQLVKLAYSADGTATLVPATALGLRVVGPRGTPAHTKVAPTSTSGTLLASNSSRVSCSFYNYGSVTVFISGDGGAATVDDWPLRPGDVMTDTDTTVAWTAITASGTGDIRVTEVS